MSSTILFSLAGTGSHKRVKEYDPNLLLQFFVVIAFIISVSHIHAPLMDVMRYKNHNEACDARIDSKWQKLLQYVLAFQKNVKA